MENTKKILTIVIPTFNRGDKLERTVSKLYPMLNDEVQLLIIDNHSDQPAEQYLCQQLGFETTEKIHFFRNPVNLGIGPNILRCFEFPTTDWIWILGDDDLPISGAIDTILAGIVATPDAININFQSNLLERHKHNRSTSSISPSLAHLADNLDCFSNLLFLSTNVYRREPMMTQLRIGYLQLQSWGPHVSMMLTALQQGLGTCVLHSSHIVHWNTPEPGKGWDYETVARQLPEVFSVIFDVTIRAKFRLKNEAVHPRVIRKSLSLFAELKKMAALGTSKPHLSCYISNFYHDLYSDTTYSDSVLFRASLRASLIYPLLLASVFVRPFYKLLRRARDSNTAEFSWITTPRIWGKKASDRL